MRRFQLATLYSLIAAITVGCPSSDDGQDSGETDGSESSSSETGLPPSSGTTTEPATTSTTGAQTTSGSAGGSADSTGEPPPSKDAECPDYASLPLDDLLLAGPGTARIDADAVAISDVEFGDFDGVTAIVGVIDDDTLLVIPLDDSGDAPTGRVLLFEGDEVFEGEGALGYDEATDAVSLATTTLMLASGQGTREVSTCFHIGSGSSSFELDGSVATIRGALGSLTYTQVQRIQAERPEVTALVLADVPGSINDEVNVETGRLVRDAGWSTHIPADGEIASGGVDLFCAGVQRTLDEGARIGVHSWSDGQMDGIDYPPESREHVFFLDYLTEMLGDPIGPEFYWFTLEAAPAADIHWMTAEEITQYQLLTD